MWKLMSLSLPRCARNVCQKHSHLLQSYLLTVRYLETGCCYGNRHPAMVMVLHTLRRPPHSTVPGLPWLQACWVRLCSTSSKDEPQPKTTEDKIRQRLNIPHQQEDYFADIFKKIKKKRSEVYFKSNENNYMDRQEAKEEYLLEDSDFSNIHMFKKASPYSSSKPGTNEYIELALTSDVIKRATEKWGGLDGLEREKERRRNLEEQPTTFTKMKQFRLNLRRSFLTDTGQVVIIAMAMNGVNTLFKGMVWVLTGSPSVFAEFMHSCVDTLNQIFLAIGRYLSMQGPDTRHPYGYRNHVHIWSIFSGLIIFGAGFGVTMYHGVMGLFHPTIIDLADIHMSLMVLLGSFLTESVSLIMAIRQIMADSKLQNMTFLQYVRGGEDPLVNVVLLEDLAGVLGVLVCGASMTLGAYLGQPTIDAAGSIIISSMLGVVAGFLYKTNSDYLLGKRLPYEDEIKKFVEADRFIVAVLDNKTIDSGDQSRFKAEVAYDARMITRHLLETEVDLDAMFVKYKSVKTTDEMEAFLEEFGIQVYEQIVTHIDRTEKNIKTKFPEIRHIDLEPS